MGRYAAAVLEVAPAVADPLLRRSPAMAVLAQGLPLALGLALHALINLVDLAMVGHLGEDALRAAHVGSTWNFLPMIVGQCVSTALLARLSRTCGVGEVAGARRANVRAQWFMVWLGVAIALVTCWPAGAMVDRTGLTGAVRGDAVHYLVVSNLGCLPMFVLMQTTAAMRAAGEALLPLMVLLLANVLNLLLALVLLFGWQAADIPAVGVVGAAYAAVVARTVAVVFAVWWLARRSHPLSLRAVPRGPTAAIVLPMLRDAWPQSLQIGLRAAVFLALTALVQHRFGDAATAALAVTTRFDTVVLFSSLGFANAATAYAGRAVVVGRAAAARAAGLWAALQAGLFGATFVAATSVLAAPLVQVFVSTPTPELTNVVVQYLGHGAWGQVLGAVALGAMGAVQGAGRMLAPLVIDLLGFPLLLLWMWNAAAPGNTLADLFGALVGGFLVIAALHVTFVQFGRWTEPRELPR